MTSQTKRDGEPRPQSSHGDDKEKEEQTKEERMDKTLADSYPASDPPSSIRTRLTILRVRLGRAMGLSYPSRPERRAQYCSALRKAPGRSRSEVVICA